MPVTEHIFGKLGMGRDYQLLSTFLEVLLPSSLLSFHSFLLPFLPSLLPFTFHKVPNMASGSHYYRYWGYESERHKPDPALKELTF